MSYCTDYLEGVIQIKIEGKTLTENSTLVVNNEYSYDIEEIYGDRIIYNGGQESGVGVFKNVFKHNEIKIE